MDKPYTDNPGTDKPCTEKPAQLNTNKVITKELITNSIPFSSDDGQNPAKPPDGTEPNRMSFEACREIIHKNIEYDSLQQDPACDPELLDEIVELMIETICSTRRTIRVAKNDFLHGDVKTRLLALNGEHIRFVFESLRENTSKVQNMKQYLLATLFNAPSTIRHYYASQVNHDLSGSSP